MQRAFGDIGGDRVVFLEGSDTRLFNAPKHDVRSDVDMGDIPPEELALQQRLGEHQQNAPKMGWAVDIRTLVEYNHGFAVMSTNSKTYVRSYHPCFKIEQPQMSLLTCFQNLLNSLSFFVFLPR
jgi:hypothetical protein